jgi:hypothetical protein
MQCYGIPQNKDVLACLDLLGGSKTLDIQIHNFLLLEIIKSSKRKCQITLFIEPKIM